MALKMTDAAINKWQRMKDDSMVAAYMAEVDTKIDSFILKCRVQDLLKCPDFVPGGWNGFAYCNTFDQWREHQEREFDLQQMIQEIRASSTHIEAERDFYYGPGAYDGSHDRYLAYVLDVAGPDYADEETGSTEWSDYLMRFGRVIVFRDDRGAVCIALCKSEDDAKQRFLYNKNEYEEWAAEQEEGS